MQSQNEDPFLTFSDRIGQASKFVLCWTYNDVYMLSTLSNSNQTLARGLGDGDANGGLHLTEVPPSPRCLQQQPQNCDGRIVK